jgi:trehalose-phosphatase
VGIDGIWYAGSHGFCIVGPDGLRTTHEAGNRFLPAVDRAERALRRAVGEIEGTLIERKDLSVAVHFRRVASADHAEVKAAVRRVAADLDGELVLTRGKMVLELQPDLDWHKGKAVLSLLDVLGLDGPETLPIFIGDDVTDEDAFEALQDRGLGILVRDTDGARPTAARHALEGPGEVRRFLEGLERELEAGQVR